MAGLGKGLKALAGSVTPPKKDINPLLKQMDQMLTLDQPNKIAEFYSPVISAIDKMPIAVEGTKGENIMGYLNKRAPNVSKAELESFSLQLDPQQKYTREQVKELAKQQGSEKYVVEVIDPKKVPYFDEIEFDEVEGTELEDIYNFSEFRGIQRQNPIDKEIGFIGLKLQGEKNYYKNDTSHFGGVENLGHSRSSIREVMPEGGPLQQKIKDRETYLFIEEAQSDIVKSQQDVLLNREKFREDGRYSETRTIYPNTPEDLIELDMVVSRDTIGDLQYEAEQSNISIDPAVLKTITDFLKAAYKDVYFYDNFKEVQRKNTELAEELRDKLKEEHNLTIYTGKTPQKVAELATLESLSKLDTGDRIEPGTHSFEGEVTEIWESFPETLEGEAKYNSSLELDPKEVSYELGYRGTLKSIRKLSPVQTRSEYLKKLLLANIAYAKQQGINKVVIPDYKEIARARIPNFIDEVEWGENSRELYRKYYEAVEKGTGDQFIKNYYETMFKPLYKDALKKVTNELKSETKGAIKVKPRNIKYKDLTEKKGYRNSDATELDITDFEFNPSTQQIRFAEGGAVPMEEQMKLFEEGGLRDEGGMVDEESGNDVPIGSTRKEVRDDIPAMLSEGEFVFPADVVRYLGLERLMNLRQEAKMGLKQMEAMGQMGNSDEATIPDDLPFGMADLVIVEGEMEPQEKAYGGVIHANQGTFVTPIFDPQNQDVRPYTNDGGQTVRYIPFLGGNPVYPIPEGYVPLDQATAPEAEETPETIPTGGDDDRTPPPEPSEFQKAGGWNMDTSATDGKVLDMWIKEAEKVSTFGNVASGIGAAINPMLGGMIALANKQQKKQIVEMLDEKIAQARKTPIQGQVAALQEVKDRLTNPERKGILAKAISEITETIGDALGLTEEEKKKSKVGSAVNATQNPEENDDKTDADADAAVNQTDSVANQLIDNGILGPEDFAPKPPETPESGEQLEVGPSTPVAIPTSSYDEIPATRTDVENILAEKSTAPEAPQIATPAKLSGPMLGEGDLEQAGVDAMPEGFRDQDKIADALGSVGRQAMTQPKFEAPIPPQYQELRTVLDDLRSSMDRRGLISGMTMPEKLEDPLGPIIGAGKFEELTNKVAEAVKPYATDRKPKPPTVSTESPKPSSNDDDGPTFAPTPTSTQTEEQAEQTQAAVETARETLTSGQRAGSAELDKTFGISGLKSGGLASRRKKK